MTNNNNKNTFEKSQEYMAGSKSPANNIEVKQVTNPGATVSGSQNTVITSSFFKKTFVERYPIEPVLEEEPSLIIRESKPRKIILNKKHHFTYKMKKNEQVNITDPKKIIKPSQPSHVVARLLSPNNY